MEQLSLFGPQKKFDIQHISLRNLWLDRDRYLNYPAFQREIVWLVSWKQRFIDSLLRGFPVPPLLLGADLKHPKGHYLAFDGKQRITAIIEFINGKFPTASIASSRREEPLSFPPIEPGRYYHQLSIEARNAFDNYKLIACVGEGEEFIETLAPVLFRRWQYHVPLTSAEMLASYQSKGATIATAIQGHEIWKQCYLGPFYRNQIYQGALCLVAVELSGGFISINANRLKEIAAGVHDRMITDFTQSAIEDRLAAVMHLFDGMIFVHWKQIVPIYQTIFLLEQRKVGICPEHKGCLTQWFGKLQVEAREGKLHGATNPLQQLAFINKQKAFWDIQLPIVLELLKTVLVFN